MTTITQYFDQAQLSLAAYATGLQSGMPYSEYVAALENNNLMSPTQAADFANTYSIVAQSGGIGSLTGFSATLFQDAQGNKYLAIRGTELGIGLDLWADATIAFGNPLLNLQIPALVNFYDQLKTDGLITPADTLTISGHSLGGYLAQLLTLADSTQISHTYTYNAPGFTSAGAQVLAASLMQQYMGTAPGSNLSSLVTNVQGIGPNIIAGLGDVIGGEQPVFTEGTTHSIAVLTDSLAVYNLLATIDPALSLNSITAILKAGSNIAANTLEATVSALGNLFLVNGAAGFNGNEFDSGVTGRDLLYTALNDIGAAIAASGGGLTLRDLTAFGAAQIASVAQRSKGSASHLISNNHATSPTH